MERRLLQLKLQLKQLQKERMRFWAVVSLPEGGRGSQQILYEEALPQGPTIPITLLYTIFHKKVPLSYTFYLQTVPLSHTLFTTLHPF